MKDLGKNSNPIKGRCNIAGSVNSEEWNIDIPEDIDTSNIPNEIITICRNQISQNHFEQMNIWKLTKFLNEQTPTLIPNLSGINKLELKSREYDKYFFKVHLIEKMIVFYFFNDHFTPDFFELIIKLFQL